MIILLFQAASVTTTIRTTTDLLTPPADSSDISCNFEVGLCGWSQNKDDKFDWKRNKGRTPTANTGRPTHYMYFKSALKMHFLSTFPIF